MRFAYVAVDQKGASVRGTLEALTARDAIRSVRGRGLLVTDIHAFIERASVWDRVRARFTRARLVDIVLLARHLALLLRAGITVDRAFDILVRQTKKRGLNTVLSRALESIRRGQSLALSLAEHPQVFPERFVAMVQWGEAGGKLPESLDHLAVQLERDRDLQTKVRGAMVYPLMVVGSIVLIGGLMAIFVLPQLADIVESFNVELPLATRIFLAISKFLIANGIVFIPSLLFSLFLLLAVSRSAWARPFLHRVYLHTPVLGRVVKMVNLARMDRAFGSLIASGIPILESLVIIRGVLGNVVYQEAVSEVIEDMRGGVGLGVSLQKHERLFPSIQTDMISIGEETGELDEVLLYLASFYEDAVTQLTKNLAQTIEPILLLVVGGIVAGVVLAIILPIYQISEAIV